MNEQQAIADYVAGLAASARRLPMAEAARLLRGALAVAGEHEALGGVRRAYRQIHEADAQLEAIEAGPLHFHINKNEA